MRRLFWRGMVVGSALGAILAMTKRPRQKIANLPRYSGGVQRIYTKHMPDSVVQGVSRTVQGVRGLIKKRS